jgi:hypothetical protein
MRKTQEGQMSRHVCHCFAFLEQRADLDHKISERAERKREEMPKRTPMPCLLAVSIARVILVHAPAKTDPKPWNAVLTITDASIPHK